MRFAWADGKLQRSFSDRDGIEEESHIKKDKEILSESEGNSSKYSKEVRPKLRSSFQAKSRPERLNL